MEIPQVADQLRERSRPHRALTLLAQRPELFRRQGSVALTWRRRSGRTFGPYHRLDYREGGRRRSIYLGHPGPLVEEVRQTLARLQGPWQRRRTAVRLRREAAKQLRASKNRVAAGLRRLGLRLQGFEVRGWRQSPIRLLLGKGRALLKVGLPSLPSLQPRVLRQAISRVLSRPLGALSRAIRPQTSAVRLPGFG